MKTQTDIVLETLQFYLEDPKNRRASTGGGCFYGRPGGETRNCALGRCMTDEALEKLWDSPHTASVLASVYGSLDQFLRPEYHGHSTKFWSRLQQLHDENAHWNPEDSHARRQFVATHFSATLPQALELGLV
jgi:hypothetical protein